MRNTAVGPRLLAATLRSRFVNLRARDNLKKRGEPETKCGKLGDKYGDLGRKRGKLGTKRSKLGTKCGKLGESYNKPITAGGPLALAATLGSRFVNFRACHARVQDGFQV